MFGLFPVRSPLLRESLEISFPRGTEMFHFPRLPPSSLCVTLAVSFFQKDGLPHSGIPGLACLAAHRGLSQPYYALHRPLMPRHPPCAFTRLTCFRFDISFDFKLLRYDTHNKSRLVKTTKRLAWLVPPKDFSYVSAVFISKHNVPYQYTGVKPQY